MQAAAFGALSKARCSDPGPMLAAQELWQSKHPLLKDPAAVFFFQAMGTKLQQDREPSLVDAAWVTEAALWSLGEDDRDTESSMLVREAALEYLRCVAVLQIASANTTGNLTADELNLKDTLIRYLKGPCRNATPRTQQAAWFFFTDSFCFDASDTTLLVDAFHAR